MTPFKLAGSLQEHAKQVFSLDYLAPLVAKWPFGRNRGGGVQEDHVVDPI